MNRNIVMDIEIKHFDDLSTEELYSILQLRSSVFVVEQQCIYQDIDGVDNVAYHLLCYEEKQIIGYLRIYESNRFVKIGRVLIDPKYRKKGYAKMIMKEAVSFIKQNIPTSEIVIAAQEYLKTFYESFEFVPISDTYLEDEIPHIDYG